MTASRPKALPNGTMGAGSILFADKGYDSNAICGDHKAWANTPPESNRKGCLAFSARVYRQHNLVERFFNRIMNFQGGATCYDQGH